MSRWRADDVGDIRSPAGIRRRFGCYVGGADARGAEVCVGGLVANGIDQFLAGRLTRLDVDIDGSSVKVRDDGPGLPIHPEPEGGPGRAIGWLTRRHDTPTADGHAPHAHLHSWGTGQGIGSLAVAVALSAEFRVRSTSDGMGTWQWTARQGVPDGDPVRLPEGHAPGTEIELVLDSTLFTEPPNPDHVRGTLLTAVHLFPGLTIGCGPSTFCAPTGLRALAGAHLATLPGLIETQWIHVRERRDDVDVQACLVFTQPHVFQRWPALKPILRGWVNGTAATGTHLDGATDAAASTSQPLLLAMVHVIHHGPHFTNPTATEFLDPKMRDIVRDLLEPHVRALG